MNVGHKDEKTNPDLHVSCYVNANYVMPGRMYDEVVDTELRMMKALRDLARHLTQIVDKYDATDRMSIDAYQLIRQELVGSFQYRDQMLDQTSTIAYNAQKLCDLLMYASRRDDRGDQ